MAEVVIPVKRLVEVSDAVACIQKIECFVDAEKLVFDFSPLEYVKMLAVALFARELRQVVKARKEKGLMTYSRGHDSNKSIPLSYLSFIGFFDFIGLSGIGLAVRHEAEVTCRNPYLAITSYNYQRFRIAAQYDSFRNESAYIADEASKVARLLHSDEDEKVSLLSYAIREILRNAYEHSNAVDFFVMGQAWRDGSAELVIMDEGMGIWDSLKKKYPRLKSEKEAILEAMKPGVSGSDFANNRYDNSGFGLYVLTEFAIKHGHICVTSGDCLVKKAGDGVECSHVWNDGTLVGIHLDSIPANVHDELAEIIKQGEIVSQSGEYPVRPSKLTWDF